MAVAPLVGKVDLRDLYGVLAQMTDIANGATVSLIDTDTNNTIASTVSTSDGGFTLTFPGGFVPTTTPYYLEAVKGLSQNGAGNPAARVRTIVRNVGGAWSFLTTGSLVVSRATTAISVIVSHRRIANDPANVASLIDSMDPGGNPPAFRPGDSGIAAGDYTTVFNYVTQSLQADLDPMAAVSYNSTARSFGVKLPSLPQILLVSPTTVTGGATVVLQGQNFNTTPSANLVSFNGTLGTVLTATTTRLEVRAPDSVVSGLLQVTTGSGGSNGVPYSVIKGLGGSYKP